MDTPGDKPDAHVNTHVEALLIDGSQQDGGSFAIATAVPHAAVRFTAELAGRRSRV